MASWIGKYDLGRESPTLRPQRREGPPRTPYYSVPLFSGPVSREYVELFRRCGWRIRYSRRLALNSKTPG